mmetsp:Transcript_58522/g.136133  ORF Transcript_58522/g.136133 Transcript_58522/m.136133 type:complete len:200 (-) Transcript_58522:116-715(-)
MARAARRPSVLLRRTAARLHGGPRAPGEGAGRPHPVSRHAPETHPGRLADRLPLQEDAADEASEASVENWSASARGLPGDSTFRGRRGTAIWAPACEQARAHAGHRAPGHALLHHAVLHQQLPSCKLPLAVATSHRLHAGRGVFPGFPQIGGNLHEGHALRGVAGALPCTVASAGLARRTRSVHGALGAHGRRALEQGA